MIAHLKENGDYDDTVSIFTSDHGEEFGERSSVGWHSHTLYEELLRVPLLIKLAGSEKGGSEVGDLARGIDIAPTALAALDIPAPATYEGRDLLSAKKTPQDREDLSVSWLDGFWTDPSKGTFAIRTGPWKFYNGRLFNLANSNAWDQQLIKSLEIILKKTVHCLEDFKKLILKSLVYQIQFKY